MKKFQSLGKALSKQEQKAVLGGLAPKNKFESTCYCADSTVQHDCAFTCVAAWACDSCLEHGGVIDVLALCGSC